MSVLLIKKSQCFAEGTFDQDYEFIEKQTTREEGHRGFHYGLIEHTERPGIRASQQPGGGGGLGW